MGNEIKGVDSKLRKRRTTIILGAAGLVVGIVALGLAWNFYTFFKMASESKQQQIKVQDKPLSRLQEKDWKGVMEVRVKKIEERFNRLEDKLQRIEKFMENIDKKVSKPRSAPEPRTSLPPPKITIGGKLPEVPGEKGKKQILLPPPPKQPVMLEGRKNLPPGRVQAGKRKPEVLREFKPEGDNKKSGGKEAGKKKRFINLPTGFTKAILLSGLDAPTLQYGRNNPHPVLAWLMDKTVLANNKDLNLKGCMVLGSAYGELSSERAYIRLAKISCLDKDGRVYTQAIKGWIFGSDGKPGIRGRLVTRFGSVLAKTFIAGTLEGISRILQATNTTVAVSPIGTTTTIQPEDVTRVAIASGFGEAARKLADFYIKLANEYFPVIEIPAGKPVAVVFEGGEKIEEQAEISNPDPLNKPDSGDSVSEGHGEGGKSD